ncbi:MAG: hypothetical protein ABIF22_02910 [bacterium]
MEIILFPITIYFRAKSVDSSHIRKIINRMQKIFSKKIDQFLFTLMLVILTVLLIFDINTLFTKDYRKLNSLQKDIIYEEISKDSNATVKIIRYDDTEIKQFAEQFKKLFKKAKIKVEEVIEKKKHDNLYFGIVLCKPDLYDQKTESLEKGFINARIKLSIDINDKYELNKSTIFVGVKEP